MTQDFDQQANTERMSADASDVSQVGSSSVGARFVQNKNLKRAVPSKQRAARRVPSVGKQASERHKLDQSVSTASHDLAHRVKDKVQRGVTQVAQRAGDASRHAPAAIDTAAHVGSTVGGAAAGLFKRFVGLMRGTSSRVGVPVYQIALAVVVVIFLAGVFLYGPSRDYYQAIREHQRLTAVQLAVHEENEKLGNQVSRLQTEEGIEDEARKQHGLVKPNENAAVVTNGAVADGPNPNTPTDDGASTRDTVDRQSKERLLDEDERGIELMPHNAWYSFWDAIFGLDYRVKSHDDASASASAEGQSDASADSSSDSSNSSSDTTSDSSASSDSGA